MTSYIANCSSGIYGWKRRVHVTNRLAHMPAAQAGVIKAYADGKETVFLVSYETIVAEISDNWLHVYGLFSNTTRRHIGAFLKEYAPNLSYSDAKDCVEKDWEVNIKTGEIRPAAQGMIQTVGTAV